MQYDVGIWRAFTDKYMPTLGNPAAVVVSKGMLDAELMQEIARQARQPMTAFLSMRSETGTNYDIRYYDLKGRECHICGHATVAGMAHLSAAQLNRNDSKIVFYLNPKHFENEDKIISASIRHDQISIELFPSILREETDAKLIRQTANVLNTTPSAIQAISYSTNLKDYVVSLHNSDVLLRLTPNFEAMKEMAETGPYQHEGLMVTALAPKHAGCDVYARVFLPITGVDEDIACGSGNCSIVPFWFERGLNKDKKTYRVIFPYPVDPGGIVGGVQMINYEPHQRITIVSQARHEGNMAVFVPDRPTPKREEPENNLIR